jgi:hypothetical protein
MKENNQLSGSKVIDQSSVFAGIPANVFDEGWFICCQLSGSRQSNSAPPSGFIPGA